MAMLRSVLTKTLWEHRIWLTGWVVGTVGLTLVIVAVYPMLVASADLQAIIAAFPPEALAVFGIDPATFLTGAGFLQGQLYALLGPIMVIGVGTSTATWATAREEQSGTMDMLLSLPIPRTSLLVQKTVVVWVSVLIIPVCMALVMVATNPIYDLELGISGIVAANLGLGGLGLIFATFAVMVGGFTGSVPATTGTTLLIAVVSWFTSAFRGVFPWLELPASVSPFSWYADDLPLLRGVPLSFLWLTVGTVGLALAAMTLFGRRDVSTGVSVLPRGRPESVLHRRFRPRTHPRMGGLLGSVFAKSVWDHRRSFWAWAVGLSTLVLLTIAAWTTVASESDSFEGLITAMPKEMFALLGVTNPELLATPEGFVSSRAYQSIGPVVIILFCVGAVTSLIIREERTGTLDVVLAHPQLRRNVLFGKFAAIIVLTTGIGVVLMASCLIGGAIWGMGFPFINVVGANLGLVALALFFGALTLALWSLAPTRRSAAGVTAGIAIGAFLLNGLGSVVDVLHPVRPLSPFYWYLGDTPPLAHGFSIGHLLLSLGAGACTWLAISRFRHRDLGV